MRTIAKKLLWCNPGKIRVKNIMIASSTKNLNAKEEKKLAEKLSMNQ
jgi:hypothetical protein